MIIGIGTDIVDIRRIERLLKAHGERFKTRCFTDYERSQGRDDTAYYAKRFAAKEACVKALGTGFKAKITMTDISVERQDSGQPTISLSGASADHLASLTPAGLTSHLHLSLSDEPPYAQAFVVIEAL